MKIRSSESESRIDYKPKVLVIQPRVNEESIRNERTIFQGHALRAGVELVFVNPLQDAMPWQSPKGILAGIDGVLHTGSSDVDLTIEDAAGMREKYLTTAPKLVREVVKRGTRWRDPIPVFGICLGHQAIHLAHGGEVARDPQQMETGTGRIQLTRRGRKEEYLQGVPREVANETIVPVFFGHKDSVVRAAAGFHVIGSTERNGYSMTRRKRVFTLQGHAEVEDTSALRHAIAHAVPDPERMGSYIPTYPMIDTPGVGTMITNFFEDAAKRGRKRQARIVRRGLRKIFR